MENFLFLLAVILAWPLGLFLLTNKFIRFASYSGYDGFRLFYSPDTPEEERQAIYDKVKKRERITFFYNLFYCFSYGVLLACLFVLKVALLRAKKLGEAQF